MRPSISVLTPTITGREWFLDRCSASVDAQTYTSVQHVVINGAGLSASEAFQKALRESEGEYLIPVSDDDWIAPHACEKLAEVLDQGHDVAFGKTLITSPGNDRIREIGGAVMWRRSLTDRLGGFDPHYRFAADTELTGRFLADPDTKVGYYPEVLYFLTEHAEHGSYVHREELALELKELEASTAAATQKLDRIIGEVSTRGDRLHSFRGVSFAGILMAQYVCDWHLWECVLNEHPQLKGIVELGTWQGGMSRYLHAQAQARGMKFVTYDAVIPDNPPPCFKKLDIYRYPVEIQSTARGMGPVALFCDGGNKPRELKTFPPTMPEGSVFLVHDWGTETLPSDVPDFLEELYGDFCDEIGSVTRVFKMKEAVDG